MDRKGRQAFAYLAIMLMVISSGYISFLLRMEGSNRESFENELRLEEMERDLDVLEIDIEFALTELHDSILLELLKDPGSWNSSSIDSELEGRLIERINSTIGPIISGGIDKNRRSELLLDSIRISVVSLLSKQSMPTSGIDEGGSPNGTGPWTYDWRQGTGGVNTTISFTISATSLDGGTKLSRDLIVDIERESAEGLLVERMKRFQRAMEGPELRELYQHMINSIAGAKAYLGSGREQVKSEGHIPDPLLTDDEINGCLDLSVHMLAGAYLGTYDLNGISGVESILRDQRGSFDCSPSIPEMLMKNDGAYDPGRLVIVTEGLFSEECPPSLDEMVRPLLLSIVERLSLGIVDYIGIDSGMVGAASGVFNIIGKVEDAKEYLVETLTGIDYVDMVANVIMDFLESLYGSDPVLRENTGKIMIPYLEGKEWNGRSIDGYPSFDPAPVNRSFILHVKNTTEREVSIYQVDSTIDLPSLRPRFEEFDLLSSKEFIDGARKVFAADEGLLGMEKNARKIVENAIRTSINDILEDLARKGEEEWEDMWKGWDHYSTPSIGPDSAPFSAFMTLSLEYLPELVLKLAPEIARNLADTDLSSIINMMDHAIGEILSDQILGSYDTLTGRVFQIVQSANTMVPEILDMSQIEVKGISYIGPGPVSYYNDLPTLEGMLDDNTALIGHAYNITYDGGSPVIPLVDNGLFQLLGPYINNSFETVKQREFGTGNMSSEMGVIRKAFVNEPTRASGGPDTDDIMVAITDGIGDLIEGISNDVKSCETISASRHFMPYPGMDGNVKARTNDGASYQIPVILNITSKDVKAPSLKPLDGIHDPDPFSRDSPYRSNIGISVGRDYRFSYSKLNGSVITLDIDAEVDIGITTYTPWPMDDVDYVLEETLFDIAVDKAKESFVEVSKILLETVTPIISGSLSSFQEVPPIVMDLVERGEFDIAEVGRVMTNITMDMTSTLRGSVKDMIKGLIEMGVSEIISKGLAVLCMDEIKVPLKIGPLEATIFTEREALEGGEGKIIAAVCNLPVIGLHSHLSLSRTGNSTIRFNGTVTFSIGGLDLRMEVDPFMEGRPHLISVSGYYEGPSDHNIRFSFCVPSLVEYRSAEISLSSSLGVEPIVPIPPLGIQAVIDGGFRIRYRMPDEITPTINEIMFVDGDIQWIEIYDPREIPVGGATIELRDGDGILIRSWLISPPTSRYVIVNLEGEDIWRTGMGVKAGDVTVQMRSSDGRIMDEVSIDCIEEGVISRDKDGYGVWRWGEGTPGSSNGGSETVSIKSLILSLVLSAIKEAWSEAYSVHGLSFDTLIHFLERSLDLFMERILEMISVLIIDVQMFLSLEVEDASGTGGVGFELALTADGEAVSRFLGWLYENICILVSRITTPQSAGDMVEFPLEIMEMCRISLSVFTEVETPISVSDLAPEGVDIPDSLRLGMKNEVNLALPLELMGMDVGNWEISFGVMIADAPDALVSLFYDVTSYTATSDLYLIQGMIWESNE